MRGERSPHFHQFNANIHFKHEHMASVYKDQLHSKIHRSASDCERSIFVFEEMDHMPEGIIDVLTPLLEPNAQVDGVDYRKTIFIFISNTGGDRITEMVLQRRRHGGKREEIKLKETQRMLELVVFNEQSGLKNSILVSKNSISHFIPFLPLEGSHVRNCIIDEMKRRNLLHGGGTFIEEVLEELLWYPEDIKLYSTSGCKKVEQKFALVRDEL
ncbi:torsin-1B-like isoform X1 [Styela clava]